MEGCNQLIIPIQYHQWLNFATNGIRITIYLVSIPIFSTYFLVHFDEVFTPRGIFH
jgi:hypothetical protein